MNNRIVVSLSFINLGLLLIFTFIFYFLMNPKIAYVNSGKLLIGFSEASKVERELKTEEDNWQKQMKSLEDSLQIAMNTMSKEYDKSSTAQKKEFQDNLALRNQQVNNFRQYNMRRMEKLRQEKLQRVFEKANVFMAEYGKTHHYSIIFGTAAGGNILYGNERSCDITDKIVQGLNERYK